MNRESDRQRDEKKRFRIIDNPVEDPRAPYALLDEESTVIRVDTHPRHLARYAFEELGADSVRHDEDLIRVESLFT